MRSGKWWHFFQKRLKECGNCAKQSSVCIFTELCFRNRNGLEYIKHLYVIIQKPAMVYHDKSEQDLRAI